MSEESIYLSLTTTWTEEPPPDPPDEPGPESEDGSISLERVDDGGALCWEDRALIHAHLTGMGDIDYRAPDLRVESSYGRIVYNGGVLAAKTETLTFARSDSASLGRLRAPGTSVSWRWLGKTPAGVSVRIDEGAAKLSHAVTGTMEVAYSITSPRWSLIGTGRPPASECVVDEDGNRSLSAVFVVYRGDQTASLNVEFSDTACDDPYPDGDPDGEDEEGPGPVEVKVVDACGTGDPIAGATVVINGQSHYLPNGVLRLENVAPKTTLAYTASATGFTTGSGSQTI